VECVTGIGWNGFADHTLDLPQEVAFLRAAEGDSVTLRPGPRRAADTVDVGVRILGELVVHHMGDAVYVNATGSNVRGDQHPHVARLEAAQRFRPSILALVAVDGGGGNARGRELLGHAVRDVLHLCEDQHLVDARVLKQACQQRVFVASVHEENLLGDPLDGRLFGRDGDMHGIAHERPGQIHDLAR
jgi:hypothetical protein